MSTNDQNPADKSAERRRKKLTDEQIRELELAGGVEGGMPAGSAGGPGEQDAHRDDHKSHQDDED
jgi:hypothetical protein